MTETASWSIKRATPEDAGASLTILREVSQWLIDIERPLWRVESFRLDELRRAAHAGELVLGYETPGPVASMLLQTRDEFYWPKDPMGEALYIHKVAVRRCAAGRHWSTRLIAFACQAAHDAGARYLRLDTAARIELLSLYQRQGFYVVDAEPRLVDGIPIYRLERPLTVNE